MDNEFTPVMESSPVEETPVVEVEAQQAAKTGKPQSKRKKKPSMDDLDELVTVTVKVPLGLKLAMDMQNLFGGGSYSDCIVAALKPYLKKWLGRARQLYAEENNLRTDD